MDLLVDLNREIPIVVVSHDISLVSAHLRRVACVSRSIQVHPTTALTPDRLARLYAGPTALVEHGHQIEGRP